MPYRVRPAVIGCAIRPAIAGRDRSLEEVIYDISQAALADAGLTIEDIDGIVVGCNDQFHGRNFRDDGPARFHCLPMRFALALGPAEQSHARWMLGSTTW